MICYFCGEDKDFFLTEYGHSIVNDERIIPPRVRDTYLLHVVLSGVCRFSEFDATAGQAFLISENKLHDFSVGPGYEHFWFAFGGERVSYLLSLFGLSEKNHVLLNGTDHARVREILYRSFEKASQNGDENEAKSVLLAVLPYFKSTKNSEKFSDSERAKLFIERNFGHRITMRQTADFVCLSEKHFCRKFKMQYGIPPQKYLLSVRMKHARELLRNTDLSVCAVAESVGYCSPQTFSQIYKEYYGFSPTKHEDAPETERKKDLS